MIEYLFCFSCNGIVPLEILNHIVECAHCGENIHINLIHPEMV